MNADHSASEKWISLVTQDGNMSALLERPPGQAKGAVIVFQEAFGVDLHIQEVCAKLAAAGYFALAPELFHRMGDHTTFSHDDMPRVYQALSSVTNEMLLMDMEAAFSYLTTELGPTPQNIAALGFCMGGFAAMLSATALPLGGAIAFYGGGMTAKRQGIGFSPILDRFGEIRCPVLCLFGDQDKGIPMEDIQKIRAALQAYHKPHEIVVYPGAGHAFFNDHRASYHPQTAQKAWAKTLEWLEAKVGPS